MKIFFIMRSLVMTIVFAISTMFFSICAVLNSLTFNNRKWYDVIISTWAQFACFIFNVKVKLHDTQHIPDAGAVFLFNHSSFFDVFALAGAVPEIRFGAKIELFSIPFFGAATKRVGTLPIARGSREEVFKVYSEARPRIKNKEKFGLSPEGGRFYGPNLFPFKAGPFIFAITSGAVLVPVIIKGAYECLPKSRMLANTDRWERHIDIYFMKPISVEGYTNETRQDLQKMVYEVMNAKWTESEKN